jgi:flagellar M-ring protein FliF
MVDTSTAPVLAGGQANSLMAKGQNAFEWTRGVTDQPGVRRAMPAIVLVSAAVLGLMIYMFLSTPGMVNLNTGLPENEKASALELLTSQGITAQLDPETGQLQVIKADFHKARMALAAEGLPAGTPDGLSTITDMPMGTSRSVESARLRRMHELDLARSISEIKVITQARVHLALPERTAFVRDTQPPRASVFLQVAPGNTLGQSQVEAIVSLVSTSIPGMPRANVSVVDQTGRLLTNGSDDAITQMSDQQSRQRIEMEELYRNRIEALITPIVGLGNAAVQVTLDMDFTRSEVMNEQFSPNQTALRSEQKMNEESKSGKAGGIPGAISNTPPAEADLAANQPGEGRLNAGDVTNTSSSSTRNYEVSRRVETIQPPSSKITRVNAAILLRAPTSADPTEPAMLPEAVLREIEALARTAIGFSDDRGDTITVSSSPFIDTFDVYEAPWYKADWLPTVGRILAQLVALAIVILGIIRPLLSRLLPKPMDYGLSPALAETVEVGEGDTLSTLRARLEGQDAPEMAGGSAGGEGGRPAKGKGKGTALPVGPEVEMLKNEAVTYEEKVALLRHLAEVESARVAAVFELMIERDKEITP